MFKKNAPLLINPSLSWSKLKWASEFLLNTCNNSSTGNTHTTIEMGLRARELYYQISDSEGLQFDLKKQGILHFYKDEKSLMAAEKSCAMFRSRGVNRYSVDRQEVFDLEPALQHAPGIVGGTYTPDDASGDIHKFCTQLSEILKSRYQVKFQYNQQVTDLNLDNNQVLLSSVLQGLPSVQEFDTVVICSGVDSPYIGKMIGESLNIYPVKGYSITVNLNPDSQQMAPRVSLLDEETKIVASRLGLDRFRVAGTAELSGKNYDITFDRIKPLIQWVENNFPGISTEHVIPWAGLRPMTPNMLPIVRAAKKSPRILLNTGHGHLGWTLAPATAEIISQQVF